MTAERPPEGAAERLTLTEAVTLMASVVKAADAASLQYGSSKGRLIPEMEMLGRALNALREAGYVVGDDR